MKENSEKWGNALHKMKKSQFLLQSSNQDNPMGYILLFDVKLYIKLYSVPSTQIRVAHQEYCQYFEEL